MFTIGTECNPDAGSVIYGMSGDNVVMMNRRLTELRYLPETKSEDFDKNVLDAVHTFQKTAKLDESDMLTPDQLKLLYSESAPKSPDYNVLRLGFTGKDVEELQAKLASLGFYDGKTTGVYTQALEAAVKRFQKDKNLEDTGCVDPSTFELIREESRKASAKVGDQLIMKTKNAANDALANLGDAKTTTTSAAVAADNAQAENDNSAQNGIFIAGFAALFAGLLVVLGIVGIKKRKYLAEEEEAIRKF